MKRWEILVWLVLAAIIVTVGYFLLSDYLADEEKPETTVNRTVNPNARLAASGSPLPAPAGEDVIIEHQQFDGRIFTLQYDQETKNWQLDFFDQGSRISLRYLVAEDMFLYFDILNQLWYEVDPDFLHSEFKEFIEIDEILLSAQQLNDFSKHASEEESAVCHQDKASTCAVWQAKNFLNQQEILIYVNKQTRKIDHIVSLDPSDPAQTSLFITYSYQPVEIQMPPPAEVRYLAE